MVSELIISETLGLIPETPEGKKPLYQVDLNFGRWNSGVPEEIIKDPTNWRIYSNLADYNQSLRLKSFIQEQFVTGALQRPKNFSLVITRVGVNYVLNEEYKRRVIRIQEKKSIDGIISEDSISEYPCEGKFVRDMWYCDIIKGYDYDKF